MTNKALVLVALILLAILVIDFVVFVLRRRANTFTTSDGSVTVEIGMPEILSRK